MRELELTVKIKNNRLLARRKALGLSQKVMAYVIGIPSHVYAGLENQQLSPVCDGEWTSAVLTTAEYFDCAPSELFPASLDLIREVAAT
jgi:DNA-binding XRE family transcriptional regulator